MYSYTLCKYTSTLLICMKKGKCEGIVTFSWFSAWFGGQANQIDLHVFKSCWDWTEFVRWKHFLALWPVIDVFINFITPREWMWCRGKLGNGEHLSSWAYKCNIHAWFEKSSIQPQRTSYVLLNFKHLLKKYIPPGTYGLQKKMAAFAITLAISGNCELY